jgi:hypothetical protein
MRKLILYDDYSRNEVHDIFDPESTFSPQAGTWGLHGIIEIPDRPRDYVFFVTFGQIQATHEFDEGITPEGVLRWQSQPKQRLSDRTIQNLIAHDEDKNSIYLFLRTKSRRAGELVPYTYLGRLKYLVHDRDREEPVYFTWQILEWDLPEHVRDRIQLAYEGVAMVEQERAAKAQGDDGLVRVAGPRGSSRQAGVNSTTYAKRMFGDHGEQDARNRQLGLAGEEAVLASERRSLISATRAEVAESVQ